MRLSHPTKKVNTRIRIPGSKSESNRLLILNALSGNKLQIENHSTARDTQNLIKALASTEETVNVLDAGTSMRFLTAYYCAVNQQRIITGSERMCQRPIHPLVNALLDLGFDVRYAGKAGFPPLEIHPVNLSTIEEEVSIEGNISSQYITALLLIAPFLEKGLKLNFTTALTSRPYIEMTLGILKHFGITHEWKDNSIQIRPSKIETGSYTVGGDWSSASYWYSIAFLADEAAIFLEGMRDDWSQGDRVMADWMKRFGVITEFNEQGALLKKVQVNYPQMMKLNFVDNPDLAQTFAPMFGAKNILTTFSGIESLKIKETDRVTALKNELQKLNVSFEYAEMYDFYQLRGTFQVPSAPIETYDDHRMAMGFAPLALLGDIEIENPAVVAKSYPEFWKDLEKAGFILSGTE
ncbi:MAG: 3-phosphoshikimate 1-carboxyvinyltransferase [Bacteroidota bacterium]